MTDTATCRRCNRPLKNSASIEAGIGKVCKGKEEGKVSTRKKKPDPDFNPKQRFLPFSEPVMKERVMTNLRMKEKLQANEAIDVSGCQKTDDGDYILESCSLDVDYCDAETESWIWSIGRDLETGQILAATSAKFYQNPQFECLWLR